MRRLIDCTVVALNIEILIFSCILNKLINTFYYSFFFFFFFFCTISIHPRIEQYPKRSRKKLQQSPLTISSQIWIPR